MARRNVTGRATKTGAQKSPDIGAGARWMVIAGHHECDAWDLGGVKTRPSNSKEYPSRGRARVKFL